MTYDFIKNLVERMPLLDGCRETIEQAFLKMASTYRSRHKVLICGNGGSAADAEHWAAELLKGFRSKRPLEQADRDKLPLALAEALQGALPTIPLTAFHALSSAFANDVRADCTFAQLTWALAQPGDLVIGISTSGTAANICAALQTARARGAATLGLTGKSGGAMRELCDVIIQAPATETYLVQEYHLPIYHCLSMMLEEEFFSSDNDRFTTSNPQGIA